MICDTYSSVLRLHLHRLCCCSFVLITSGEVMHLLVKDLRLKGKWWKMSLSQKLKLIYDVGREMRIACLRSRCDVKESTPFGKDKPGDVSRFFSKRENSCVYRHDLYSESWKSSCVCDWKGCHSVVMWWRGRPCVCTTLMLNWRRRRRKCSCQWKFWGASEPRATWREYGD